MEGCHDRITINDVARKAGVSVRTVSRVINDQPNVKIATREKIQRIIEDCGFQPNLVARSLRRRRTNTIVIFIAHQRISYWSQFYTRIINDMTAMAHEAGYHVIISDSNPLTFEENENDGFYLLRNGYADAAVILDASDDDRRMRYMDQLSIPYSIFGKTRSGPRSSRVYFDNFRAGEMIGEFILERNLLPLVGFFGEQRFLSSGDRMKGIAAALGRRSGEFTSVLGCVDMERSYKAALGRLDDFRCAFVSGDERAMGIYRAAYEMGLEIPTHISVIGFDDVPFASYMAPPLTTVRQPFELIARDLILSVRGLLEDDTKPSEITHGPELIERGSTPAMGE